MGNTSSEQLSVSPTADSSVILPVPLYLTSPHCTSTESITSNKSAFQFECNSSTYTDTPFLFEIDLGCQINDCWNSFHPQKFGLNKSAEMMHTIHRISKHSKTNKNNTNNKNDWMSVFGTQIIHKGECKLWKLKIYPRNDSINHIIEHKSYSVSDIVVGIVDAQTVRNELNNDNKMNKSQKYNYNNYNGGFWTVPYFGYGYYGFNGKKFHDQRRGKQYGDKFKVGDTVTIDLDLQCNQLKFYVNDIDNGLAFNVDGNRNYVLALALSDDNYDIQICSADHE